MAEVAAELEGGVAVRRLGGVRVAVQGELQERGDGAEARDRRESSDGVVREEEALERRQRLERRDG